MDVNDVKKISMIMSLDFIANCHRVLFKSANHSCIIMANFQNNQRISHGTYIRDHEGTNQRFPCMLCFYKAALPDNISITSIF